MTSSAKRYPDFLMERIFYWIESPEFLFSRAFLLKWIMFWIESWVKQYWIDYWRNQFLTKLKYRWALMISKFLSLLWYQYYNTMILWYCDTIIVSFYHYYGINTMVNKTCEWASWPTRDLFDTGLWQTFTIFRKVTRLSQTSAKQ